MHPSSEDIVTGVAYMVSRLVAAETGPNGIRRQAVARKARTSPGTIENIQRGRLKFFERVEARFGIPFSALWALRYRPPKDIGVSIYARLQAAHESVREAQMRKFTDEYERAKAASGADAPLVRAAAALVGKDEA